MKRKIKTVRLLANFFRDEYYGAYKELIRQLSPLLQNPDQLPSQILRLDFKPDLPRGTKKLIYQHIARLLQSGDGVFRKPYCRNDLGSHWDRCLGMPHTPVPVTARAKLFN